MGSPIYSDTLAERSAASRDPDRRQRAAYAHALRSASGGYATDNRRVQAEAVKGEVYLAIDTVANAVQGVTATLTQLRRNLRSLRKIEKARRDRAYRRGRAPRDTLAPDANGYVTTALRGANGYVTKALPTPDAHANDKQRKPVLAGPLVALFDRPNALMTLAAFLALWRLQEMLTGNVLVWCNPDAAGRTREMFVLPTALCQWQPPTPQYPRGAWHVYQSAYGMAYGNLYGSHAIIPAEQVLHYKHLGHPLYHWDGLSPLTAVSKWVDVLDAIDRSCWSSMTQGVRRGTLVIVPGMSADEAAAQNEQIRRDKAGTDNAGAPWVIGTNHPESKPEVHDPDSPREMDFQTSRQNYAGLVLAAMGVPPIVANLKEAPTHAALYASIKQFRDLTLIPWLSAVAAALNAGPVASWDDGGDGLKVQFDLQTVLNEDLAEATKSRQQQNGVTTHNEDRRGDNQPPHADRMADVLPTALFNKYLEQKHLPPPAPPPGQPGPPAPGGPVASPAAAKGEADPGAILAGLGGGPDSGDAPRPANKAAAGSLPPQTKAVVRKATDTPRREGEVWRGDSGRYFTLSGGHVVPAKDPGAAAREAEGGAGTPQAKAFDPRAAVRDALRRTRQRAS